LQNYFALWFAKLNTKTKYAILLFAGIASVFSLAPFFIWPIYAIGIIILFNSLDDAKHNKNPLKSAFWRAFTFAFGFFAFGLFWVAQAFLVDAKKFAWLIPFAMSALPACLGLFFGLAGFLYRRFAPDSVLRIFWFALCFGFTEYLRGTLFTGFPWNLPAYIFNAGGYISQSASLIGPYGVSLFILLIFASLNVIWEKNGRLVFIFCAIITVAANIFGYIQLKNAPRQTSDFVVAIGQGGFTQKELWQDENRDLVVSNYINQLKSEAVKNAKLIVWPEGTFPFDLFTDDEVLRAINPLIKDKVLIVGAPHSDFNANPNENENKYFNSLAFLGGSNTKYPDLLAIYDKFHLVPFGEYLPFRKFLNSIGISSLVAYGSDFSPGDAPKILKIGDLPAIDPRICYEIIFPNFNQSQIRAQFIVNSSVDAWYGDYLGPDQHYNQSRWRAIETGTPLVRAAAGGWSGIIDANGRPLHEFRRGNKIISGNLPLFLPQNFYTRYGNGVFLLIMVVFAAITSYKRVIKLQ
jgi:apolipoprotein N-acyltransferase